MSFLMSILYLFYIFFTEKLLYSQLVMHENVCGKNACGKNVYDEIPDTTKTITFLCFNFFILLMPYLIFLFIHLVSYLLPVFSH